MITKEMENQIIDLIVKLPLNSWSKNRSNAWENTINECRVYIWHSNRGTPGYKFVIDGVDFTVPQADDLECKLNSIESEYNIIKQELERFAIYNKVIKK